MYITLKWNTNDKPWVISCSFLNLVHYFCVHLEQASKLQHLRQKWKHIVSYNAEITCINVCISAKQLTTWPHDHMITCIWRLCYIQLISSTFNIFCLTQTWILVCHAKCCLLWIQLKGFHVKLIVKMLPRFSLKERGGFSLKMTVKDLM